MQPIKKSIVKKSLSIICKVVGHNWYYKDYSNWMKENGDNYDFKAARKCTICGQHEYLIDGWKNIGNKSRYDILDNSQLQKRLQQLQ